MKRYGDNLPSSAPSEEKFESERDRNAMVMYGGCGVSFGTFSKHIQPAPKRKALNLWSFLGFMRNKRKKEDS